MPSKSNKLKANKFKEPKKGTLQKKVGKKSGDKRKSASVKRKIDPQVARKYWAFSSLLFRFTS